MHKQCAFVCFGEILLRLNTPGHERLGQAEALCLHVGGAEANVAIALAQLGNSVRMVSVLPDNALGHQAYRHLQSFGVDCSSIQFVPGRMGLYFAETGAVRRATSILYDRAGSVFAEAKPQYFDWEKLLYGADHLHLSGITPATGPGPAEASLEAVQNAKRMALEVSFDGNYRAALWEQWGGAGREVIAKLLAESTIAFINEKDIALALDKDAGSRDDAVQAAFGAFDGLHTVACTTRTMLSASDMMLAADAYTRDDTSSAGPFSMQNVVERIGGGDAFAAGFLHARYQRKTLSEVLNFGLAASIFKHSIAGDQLIASRKEIENTIKEETLDIRR